ncbi:hypothetical protein Plhal304r1_c040g0117581 [Plasmopara halstedii]
MKIYSVLHIDEVRIEPIKFAYSRTRIRVVFVIQLSALSTNTGTERSCFLLDHQEPLFEHCVSNKGIHILVSDANMQKL